MKKNNIKIVAFVLCIAPTLASAAAASGTNNFSHLVGIVVAMVKSLIPLVIALSLLYFSWGLFQLIKSNNEGKREEAVTMMTFGIIAMFVMVGIWGLVNVLTVTFFSGAPIVPLLK